jgi:hypothetical protein
MPAALNQAAEIAQLQAQLPALIDRNPNEPQIMRAVEALIDATGGSADAVRLLFQLYLHPRLCDAAKGIATAMIVKVIRRDAGHFDARPMGLDPESRAFKMIHRGLRHHLDQAVEELALLARFQHGQVDARSAPKFIVAIPKSGSSLLGMCLGGMIALTRGVDPGAEPFAFRGYPAWWSLAGTHDWDLRPEIGADPLFKRFPGGVYKGHITPTDKNFAILDLYAASRYLVCVRDPRDQIVAAYCDTIRARQRGGESVPGARTEREVHDDVLAFLRSGLLLENLSFVGKWLARRHADRSLVVTYERLMAEPREVLRQVADHFALGVTDGQIGEIHERAAGITDRTGTRDTSGHDRGIYPLGWTGRVGVWRTYFSDEAARAFGAAFAGFGGACPWGREIERLYPALGGPGLGEPKPEAAGARAGV